MLIYYIYQSVVTIAFILLFPFVFLVSRVQKGEAPGLGQRFGVDFRCPPGENDDSARIWIHAASVGEVQAARILISELKARKEKFEFFLSTMTQHGHRVAINQLPADVHCFLAPLDAIVVVRRFISAVQPDIYVCLETELWPAMFTELHRQGVPALVLNGRLTPRSVGRYKKIAGLMSEILGGLSGVGAISAEDGNRFTDLGVSQKVLRVTGNIKYDYPEEDAEVTRKSYRELLQVGEETVFICGSTRTGEEEILLGVHRQLQQRAEHNIVWVIAPRHLDRLDEVRKVLTTAGIAFDLYSKLKEQVRSESVVLVDTMGDLSRLYSAGDLNFVGGSLVDKRGHNIMEAARWGKPVYYGPSIDDFKDAAEILEKAGGGFRVRDENALATELIEHLQNKEKYKQACESTAQAVSQQRGAAGRQGDMVVEQLSLAQTFSQN